jgi:hypothetical protein
MSPGGVRIEFKGIIAWPESTASTSSCADAKGEKYRVTINRMNAEIDVRFLIPGKNTLIRVIFPEDAGILNLAQS